MSLPSSARGLSRAILWTCLVGVGLALPSPGPAGADEPPPAAPAEPAPPEPAEVVADLKADEPDVRAAACRAAAGLTGDAVLKALVRCLEDPILEVRQEAILALGARTVVGEARKAVTALLGRLARKGVPEDERLRLVGALHDLARPESVRPLLAAIDRNMPDDEVEARLQALANVPADEAIERLIQFLDRGHRAESRADRDAAMRALRYATGQRFGREADAWRAWWREVGKDYDHAAAAARRAEVARAAETRADRRKNRAKERANGGEPDPAPADDAAPPAEDA